MPNWCYGQIEVKGKPLNIENFCKLFLFDNKKTNSEYFARSFANINWDDFKIENDNFKDNSITFGIDFAWSVAICIIDGYPQDKDNSNVIKERNKRAEKEKKFTKEQKQQNEILNVIENEDIEPICITLTEACKKYEVNVEIESEERGMGFTEHIICNNKGKLILNKSEDLKTEDLICKKCGKKQEIMIGNRDIIDVEEECDNCGEYEWKLKK